MTRDELIQALKELHGPTDEEIAHSRADRLLLEYIGDEEVTAAFDAINKWYA